MAWVFDRPGQGNGFDERTMADMETALGRLESADSDVTCLCIAGNETVFSTGLDGGLLEVCFSDREKFAAVVLRTSELFDRIEALPIATIACIDGDCRLGGLELALACDLVVVGAGAEVRDGHMAYDAMPGAGGTNRLPARLGYSGALRFILEAPVLSAREAVDRGLADELAPSGAARRRGEEIAAAITERDPQLVRDIKASLRAAQPVIENRFYVTAFRRSVVDRLIPE